MSWNHLGEVGAILSLESTDTFEIPGRGQVFTFDNFPKSISREWLLGRRVRIDGSYYIVTGIEQHGGMLSPYVKSPAGILVKPCL